MGKCIWDVQGLRFKVEERWFARCMLGEGENTRKRMNFWRRNYANMSVKLLLEMADEKKLVKKITNFNLLGIFLGDRDRKSVV